MNTVRFKLSRNCLIAPGVDGKAGQVIDATPVQAAELLTVNAGALVNPEADHSLLTKAVRAWQAAQPRLDRPR